MCLMVDPTAPDHTSVHGERATGPEDSGPGVRHWTTDNWVERLPPAYVWGACHRT